MAWGWSSRGCPTASRVYGRCAGSRSRSRSEASRATVRGDTMAIAARQVTIEEGQVDWDPATGLLRRTRHIVVETSVPAGGPLRAPLRSRLEQDVVLDHVGHPGSANACK